MKRRVRFFGWGNKGRKLSTPTPDDGKLELADILLFVAATMIIRADKFNWIADFPYKEEVITSVAIVLIICSFYRYYHKLCPMSRWSRSSWASAMIAITWTATPMILYLTGINSNWERMWYISAWSSVMWIVFLFCYYKLYRVKQRTKAQIAMIDMRKKSRKIY
ncbi:MAG: hypothetical protein J6K33_06100 [Alistipes sp.]|nr:hypothetical protein [Alistipes sp.]